MEFQYIPCYGLSRLQRLSINRDCKISIHPMLRFINFTIIIPIYFFIISIHPMLRFITVKAICWSIHTDISIHPMLRFIPPRCRQVKNMAFDFNTSHVTVYLMILSHFYLGIFHHFLYFTSFQHFLPADYKI